MQLENKDINENPLNSNESKIISNEENRRHGIDTDMFKQLLRSIPTLENEEIRRGKADRAQYIILGSTFFLIRNQTLNNKLPV